MDGYLQAIGVGEIGRESLFRCDNCGSGYSAEAAASWPACPRCLAKERIKVPLSFELGWSERAETGRASGLRPLGGTAAAKAGRDRPL
jgi:hypothetical protein